MITFTFGTTTINVSKICSVFIKEDEPTTLVVWLEGGQTHVIHHKSNEDCIKAFRMITSLIQNIPY